MPSIPSSPSPSPSASSASSPPSPTRKRRARVLRTLSQAQQLSALAFGSFAIVHLAAPALALVAPRNDAHELATGTMLLGRVWYQNVLSEPVLVWGALSVHLASSFARKGILVLLPATPAGSTGRSTAGRGEGTARSPASVARYAQGLASYGKSAFRRLTILSDVHTLSGWLLAPFVLHHAYLNRIVPSSPEPPINALSPSELDYTYVTHAFGPVAGALTTASRSTSRSLLSSVSYAALIGLSLYHSSHGIRKILEWRARGTGTGRSTGGASSRRTSLSNTEARSEQVAEAGGIAKVSDTSRRRRPWDLATIVASLVIGGGLTRLVMEADGQPPFLLRRYEACYSLVWPYTRTL